MIYGAPGPGPVDHGLRPPGPRVPGDQRPALRHDRALRERVALAGRATARPRATWCVTRRGCRPPPRWPSRSSSEPGGASRRRPRDRGRRAPAAPGRGRRAGVGGPAKTVTEGSGPAIALPARPRRPRTQAQDRRRSPRRRTPQATRAAARPIPERRTPGRPPRSSPSPAGPTRAPTPATAPPARPTPDRRVTPGRPRATHRRRPIPRRTACCGRSHPTSTPRCCRRPRSSARPAKGNASSAS